MSTQTQRDQWKKNKQAERERYSDKGIIEVTCKVPWNKVDDLRACEKKLQDKG